MFERIGGAGDVRCGRLIAGAVLFFSGSVCWGQEIPRQVLQSEDDLEVVRALVQIAEAGPAASGAEAEIVKLMVRSARGRRLSRWCLFALDGTGVPVERHIQAYMKATSYREPQRGGSLTFRCDPSQKRSGLPPDLRDASTRAWEVCIRAVAEVEGVPRRYIRGIKDWAVLSIRQDADREIFGPIALDIARDEAQSATARMTAMYLLQDYSPCDEVGPVLFDIVRGETEQDLRLAAVRALAGHFGSRGYCADHAFRRSTVPVLLDLLDFQSAEMRLSAMRAITQARVTEEEKSKLLKTYRSERDPGTRDKMLAALVKRGGMVELLPELMDAARRALDRRARYEAVDRLGGLGIALHNAGRTDERAEAARKVVPLLIDIMNEEDPDQPGKATRGLDLTVKAILALTGYGELAAEAVPDMLRIFRSTSDRGLKNRLVYAFGCIGPAAAVAVPDIIKHGPTGPPGGIDSTPFVLGNIGKQGKEVDDYLASLLDSEYGRHNPWSYIDALGKVGSNAPEVMAILEEYRQKEPYGRRAEQAIDAIIERSGGARQETEPSVEF